MNDIEIIKEELKRAMEENVELKKKMSEMAKDHSEYADRLDDASVDFEIIAVLVQAVRKTLKAVDEVLAVVAKETEGWL